GLKPAPGAHGYFQPFPIVGRPALGKTQELAFNGPHDQHLAGTLKTDFSPLAIGTSAELTAIPIVFAGYGITAEDAEPKLHSDDYAGIDVQGKAVLILRREPQQGNEASPFQGKRTIRTGPEGQRTTPYATFQHKATNAFQHGAAAVLLVNDRGEVKDGK